MKVVFKPLILLIILSCILIACGGGSSENSASNRQLYSFSQGSVGFYYNPPTLVDNHVYIGTSRGAGYSVAPANFFFRLDSSLNKVWEYPLGNKEVRGGAALDSFGNVYFVVEDAREENTISKFYLYSLDNNGIFRWSRLIVSYGGAGGMSNPAIAADDTIYVGGDKFYAYDVNGNEKWNYRVNDNASFMQIMNAPVVDPDGNIYFSANGYVISLDSAGTERWLSPTTGEFYSSPVFSTDYSKIFVGSGEKVLCLEAGTGSKVWEFIAAGLAGRFGAFRATPAVDSNNNVYIGTKDNNQSIFYAIKADGSGLLWKKTIGADLYSSPAIGDDNTVYVGSEIAGGLRLHALDMSTGITKWAAALRADVTWSSPALSDTGILYIASMDYDGSGGGVYAFRTGSTGLLTGAGSPRFHEGNLNTGRRE